MVPDAAILKMGFESFIRGAQMTAHPLLPVLH